MSWLLSRYMAKGVKDGISLICDNCGKKATRVRHLTRSYGKGQELLVIEGIPVVSLQIAAKVI